MSVYILYISSLYSNGWFNQCSFYKCLFMICCPASFIKILTSEPFIKLYLWLYGLLLSENGTLCGGLTATACDG